MIKYEQNSLLPADTSCIDISSVPRSCDDEGSPPGRRPWRSSANDKLIPESEFWEKERVLPWMHWWAAARPTSQSPRTPKGTRPGSAGARAARPSWRTPASGRPRDASRGRTWADPVPGDPLQLLRWTDIQTLIWYSFLHHAPWYIYILIFTLNYPDFIQ